MSDQNKQEEDYTSFTLSAQHNGETGSFSDLSKSFKDDPTLEHYLELRRGNPGQLVEIATNWSLDWCFENEERVEALGINIKDVVGSLDADEACASRLSLRLIELIVERRALEQSGETQVVGRGDAISDSLISYLIAMMLDALDWNDQMTIPRDLIVLIKHQLRADVSAESKAMEVKTSRTNATWIAAQMRERGEAGSIRQVAKAMQVSPTTVMRWFSDRSYEEDVEKIVQVVAGDDFKQMMARSAAHRSKPKNEE